MACPNFLTAVSGSIVAILSSLNTVLYSNDPDDIPLTDIERAGGTSDPSLLSTSNHTGFLT